MAVITYTRHDHPANWKGVRAATTLGTETEYRQIYFRFSKYSPEEADKLAREANEKWRRQAEAVRAAKRLEPRRQGSQYIARNFTAYLRVDRAERNRDGKRVIYCGFRTGEIGHGAPFKQYPFADHGYDMAFELALRHFDGIYRLSAKERRWVRSRKPDPEAVIEDLVKASRGRGVKVTVRQAREAAGL